MRKDSLRLAQCFWSLTVQWLCFVMVLTADEHDPGRYPGATKMPGASAFYCDDHTFNWTFPPFTSIYTIELYAIRQALFYCSFSEKNLFLICSDSKSALQVLRENNKRNPLVSNIFGHLQNCHNRIIFIWNPAHVGIPGNEAADEAAREATSTYYKTKTVTIDEELYKLNFTLKDILSPDSNNYLNFDFNAFWSHNESYYLSKLDDFDVYNIQDVHANDFDATTEKPWWRNSQNSNLKGAGINPKDPIFDNNLVTNVTVQLGETAFLRCRVRNLGERPVSWVRRRDWHILTSGMFTYTNDERFQVVHTEGGDDWNLQIKYVQKRDNGTYECQVATGKGTISHYYNLHVVVPSAFILGSGEYHIGEGSTISLVCIIENSPSPPQYVFWYHNERMINYDTTRGGVTVSTEPGPKTHSRLIINSVTTSDSGNYTCRASNTEADTIYVFVSKGDNTAAIQRQESFSTRCGPLPFYIFISTSFNIMR